MPVIALKDITKTYDHGKVEALAHGDEDHSASSGPVRKEQKDWGIAGDASAAKRTLEFRMSDNMRFTPSHLDVTEGDPGPLHLSAIKRRSVVSSPHDRPE